jgi:FkbM family methyltransferase
MSVSVAQQALLMDGYSLLRRSGLLQTSAGRRLFQAAYFLYKRHIEDDLQDLTRSRPGLLKGGNVLDIGANIGYTASILARAIEPDRKVYAFEPEPFNYEILRRVAAGRSVKDRIVALQCAVGADNGTVDLWLNHRHHADHRVITPHFRSAHSGVTGTLVPMVTIDRFLNLHPGPVSFVKIDVQGYELAVCEGMKDTLEKNGDLNVVLEFMPSAMRDLGFDPSHLVHFLLDRGFRAYCIHPKGRLSMGIPTAGNASSYVDLLFSRHRIECGGEG